MQRLSPTALPEGISTPTYLGDDVEIGIVHFGVGNFHRAHQAMYVDRLLNAGARGWGVCGVGLFERDARMRDALTQQGGLYTLTLRHADGRDETSVIGSIRRFLHAPDAPDALLEQLADPRVRIVSLTITEGGYVEDPLSGKRAADDPAVAAEAATALAEPRTAFGWIVDGLRERRHRGVAPFTVMTCDNIPDNGSVARRSVVAVARLVDADLADWIEASVAFPSTMVDRITPVTVPADVERIERAFGVHDEWPVAAEPFEQWVVEDRFPTGRPRFDEVGVTMVDDVRSYEDIKLRLLNGGHQAIAYLGRLRGHVFVHDAMADPVVADFARAYMDEGKPTLDPPAGFDLDAYADELISRFGNPAIADTLDRLGTDASNRVAKFVVPMIVDRLDAGVVPAAGARMIASWYEFNRRAAAGEFTLDDEAAEQLLRGAADPRDFLQVLSALAPLAASEAFTEIYLGECAAMRSGV